MSEDQSASGKRRRIGDEGNKDTRKQRRLSSISAISDDNEPSGIFLTSPLTRETVRAPRAAVLGACRSVQEFEKVDRIGEGSYGIVYKARDNRNKEIVALKRVKMKHEHGGLPLSSLREITLLREARGHDNIVKLTDVVVGRELTSVFLAMEYCERDLASLIDTLPVPFHESQVKCLMLQLIRGVEWLHKLYIVHRDLKLSNLLLTRDGILKIADFGLARKCGTKPDGATAQPLSAKVVTLWYRPPEVLFGETAYNFAVDMWGVGCIFGEFLTHAPLMPGKSDLHQLELIVNLLGAPSEEIWPGLLDLPLYATFRLPKQPYNNLRDKVPYLSQHGLDLLNQMFKYDPTRRTSALKARLHPYWHEEPLPVQPGECLSHNQGLYKGFYFIDCMPTLPKMS
eukprot:m.61202 g.61202  ORF g.61202 m.61202 type:complete len:398 (+) comp11386_c0_seq1:365-1558(+)